MQRHLREAGITPREARGVMADFVEDEEAGVWSWLPVTSTLIRRVCDRVATLPRGLLLRAGDAIHLGCARLVVPPRDANTGSNPVGATIPISSVIFAPGFRNIRKFLEHGVRSSPQLPSIFAARSS